MPNQYVEFVKMWSRDNNLSYMCAVTDPRLKSDYLKYKKGEEIEVNFKPLKRRITKQAKELKGMSQQDRNVAMPRSKINASQLISKLEQIKELAGMGSQDRNVGLKISNVINQLEQEIEEEIDFEPAPKKKPPKSSLEKIKVNGTDIINKMIQKAKDLVNNSKLSNSEFKKLQSELLDKIDNIIEKMLQKQDNSTDDQVIDLLEEQMDKLSEVYKKLSKVKKPRVPPLS